MRKKSTSLRIGTLFIYVIIFTLMIIVFFWLNHWASENKSNVFQFPSIVLHISPIVMIFFGVLFNFEKIIELLKEKGSLSIDWLRVLIVVLPLTPISFMHVVQSSNVLQYSQVFRYILLAYYIRPPVVFVAQFLQGFLLVNCFSKSRVVENAELE